MKKNIGSYLVKAFRRIAPASLTESKIHATSKVLGFSRLRSVVFGKYSYCGFSCTLSDCIVGAYCSIADNVVIGGAEHPLNYLSTSPLFHNIHGMQNIFGTTYNSKYVERAKHTTIGNDVWIGTGALIKSGVNIGDGAVIGMGSVVTKNVPEYTVWAGNPAKQIKQRFDENTIKAIVESEWWERDDEVLRKVSEYADDPTFFVESIESK